MMICWLISHTELCSCRRHHCGTTNCNRCAIAANARSKDNRKPKEDFEESHHLLFDFQNCGVHPTAV